MFINRESFKQIMVQPFNDILCKKFCFYDTYLFESQSYTREGGREGRIEQERERERERGREIFHLLFLSPTAKTAPSLSKEPGASSKSFTWAARAQTPGPRSTAVPDTQAGSCARCGETGPGVKAASTWEGRCPVCPRTCLQVRMFIWYTNMGWWKHG